MKHNEDNDRFDDDDVTYEVELEDPDYEDENDNEDDNDALRYDEDEDNDGNHRHRRRWSRKKRIAWSVGSAVFLILFIVGLVFFMNYRKAKQRELMAYEVLENNECIADYEEFLKAYPESKYSDEVKKRMEELKAMYKDWDSATKANTRDLYTTFRDKYPKSILLGHKCSLKIDSLDWVDAQALGTIEAYRHYLSLHPTGLYAQEASIASGQIDDVTMRDGETEEIGSRVRGFFSAFSAGSDGTALGYVSIPMSECLGHSGSLRRDEILEALHEYNGGVVETCNFTVGHDVYSTKSVDANGVPSYNVTCSVDMHAVIAGCDAYSSYRAQITMNSKYRITRLRLIEVATM